LNVEVEGLGVCDDIAVVLALFAPPFFRCTACNVQKPDHRHSRVAYLLDSFLLTPSELQVGEHSKLTRGGWRT